MEADDGGKGRPGARGAARLLVRQVPVPRRDPRGPRLPLAAARTPPSRSRSAALIASAAASSAPGLDPRKIEEDGWIGDDVIRELGERGLCGLYVPERVRRPGPLPDRLLRACSRPSPRSTPRSRSSWACTSRSASRASTCSAPTSRRSASSPTSPPAASWPASRSPSRTPGSDAYNIAVRAVQQPDGSWVLNGEKRYIGNGGKGSVFTTFARCEVDGKDRHIALILEKGMKGFEVGERFDTMGLRGQRPAPPLLQGRAGAARERARRARRGLPASPWRSSTTGGSASAPAPSAPPSGCSTRRSTTSRSAASSAVRWPSSSWSRTRSAGWSPTCSGSSRCAT